MQWTISEYKTCIYVEILKVFIRFFFHVRSSSNIIRYRKYFKDIDSKIENDY